MPEDEVEEGAGDSSTESVVIVEEVVAADEDGSSPAAVEEPLTGSFATTDLANALLTIQQLREEIKDLLNRVELQRYEVEKLRGRQRDLYDDLDQRLRKQERLVLTVPVPSMPSVESIVIAPEEPIPAAPTPMVAGTKQPSSSVELSTEGATEIAVMSETQDEETPVVTVVAETVVTVPAPTPMVAGTDLSIPSADSGASVIVQPQIQGETQDEETPVVTVVAETVVTVPAPTPMVAGTDLPIPSADSGAAVIVLPQTQAETPESEARDGVCCCGTDE